MAEMYLTDKLIRQQLENSSTSSTNERDDMDDEVLRSEMDERHLREYVDDTEDYIIIMLDDKQNQLLQMGFMLTTKNEWLQSKTDMSSISQSILMALTVTVNKYASSNVQAVHRKRKRPTTTSTTADIGRRGLFLSTVVAALQVSDSRTELLQKYLKKSQENKAKNDKERLESYYKRNYKDYFELVQGTLKGKDGQISEAEKGILDWLQSNK
ncbi:Photosystem I reaction centre subunit N [Parasponia andersonii]|uniref:Photosystem I reaction centre subunit N n=1 Tax=Parasponia andersonii TaxID=3476 RepID=A0A2P5CXQ4_PARAD|nr:Photosystem I reaction centre subunit N [Parasponia andersonii]